MPQKPPGGGSGIEVPQSESAVPRAAEGKLAVTGDHNILDKVGVASQSPFGMPVVAFFSSQIPDNDRLIPASITHQAYSMVSNTCMTREVLHGLANFIAIGRTWPCCHHGISGLLYRHNS